MLYKRGEIWWVKFKAQGETIRRSTGTTKRRQAEIYERDIRSEYAQQLHIERTGDPSHKTYGEALLKWINSGAPKGMWSPARNTRPYLEDVPLHLIVPAAHNMKQEMLAGGLKVSTINRRLAVVRRVLNVAYKEWDWLKEPLGQKIQLFSEKGMAREFYLSQEEVDELVSHMSHPGAIAITRIAAYTGLRQGEIMGLTDEHWNEPYIILKSDTKGKKPRIVPLIKELHHYMESLPIDCNLYWLRHDFEKARDAMGRPEIRFHDLRHTYASWLAKNPDVPLTTIRDLLGHSNLSVTSKYAHLRSDSLELVTKALGKSGHNEGDEE